jgi:spermidine/putrescine transport system substrate-binding protein
VKRFLLFALVAVVSCGKPAPPPPGPVHRGELHLLIWAEYLDEGLIKGFETEFNCRVVVDNFTDGEALRAKIDHPPSGFDVVVPSDDVLPGFIADGYLEKLDRSKLPNLKNIGAKFLGMPFDPKNEYSVPFHWGLTGFASTAALGDSWTAFFDAKVARDAALLDDPREVFAAVLRLQGAELSSATAEQIEAAKDRLLSVKPKVWESQPQRLLIQGDVKSAMIYHGDAAQVMAEKSGLTFVVPKEGGTIWFDNLAIAKGSTRAALAHQFIDYLMRPEVAGANTNKRRYPSPNDAAKPHIDKAILSNPTIYPPDDVLKRCKPLGDMKPEMRKKLMEAWGAIKGR